MASSPPFAFMCLFVVAFLVICITAIVIILSSATRKRKPSSYRHRTDSTPLAPDNNVGTSPIISEAPSYHAHTASHDSHHSGGFDSGGGSTAGGGAGADFGGGDSGGGHH